MAIGVLDSLKMTSRHGRIKSVDGDSLAPPSRGRDGRSYSNAESSRLPGSFAPSTASHAPPGSFSSDLRSVTTVRSDLSRPDYFNTFPSFRSDRHEEEQHQQQKVEAEQRQAGFRDQLEREMKIKIGSENLLEALHFKKHAKEQRIQVESKLDETNKKIAQLKQSIAVEIERSRAPSPTKDKSGRLSQLFQHTRTLSQQESLLEDDADEEDESPTYVLVETLQALEDQGHASDYYVNLANNLTELFRRNPTLKYDLVWLRFGPRVQGMLLSDNKDVAAAGFRMIRYAITDRKSLATMRSFSIDYFVVLALAREGKDSVEREQALKFVRAFMDVKEGVDEIALSVIRVLVAIAEQHEDRLRNIAIMTLSEILIRKPSLVAAANGIGALADALSEGLYMPAEGLSTAFLYLLDLPSRRKYFESGFELQGPFAAFSDESMHIGEERLKTNAKVIAGLLKTWPGLITLSNKGFLAIRSLTTSLYQDSARIRDIVLEIILDIMRIKPPSWSASYLAGRRLTTYGRVTNVRSDSARNGGASGEDGDLIKHFTALLMAVFVRSGLVAALAYTLQNEKTTSIKRKAILLMGEALDLANNVLPSSWTQQLQVLPSIFNAASVIHSDHRFNATSLIYQIDSVNRTLYRTEQKNRLQALSGDTNSLSANLRRASDLHKDTLTPQIDESVFRNIMQDTQVTMTPNFRKWRWELIQKIIEGPLQNGQRLDQAMKQGKFIKRLIGFYRPFKYRFSDVINTRQNQQRYVYTGCLLVKALLEHADGVRYLAENKLLRQLAECLAQVDRLSGLTSASPLFSASRVNETLTGGYFALLGAISSSNKGLVIIERWRMANMFYHIIELQDRDDLIKALLSNMDYTLDSHLRVVLSKALTSCSDDIRVFGTRILRKYVILKNEPGSSSNQVPSTPSFGQTNEWAIDLLVTQLYDPQVEVCEIAIKLLEEACNDVRALEYVVQCRPALDHLGEIGGPLLLRFLSTSIGYHYLDELDYISQEMDDWFLGRNETYVHLVEASIAKAMSPAQYPQRHTPDDVTEEEKHGFTPPHFYRELTRTSEGCDLLENKGHFSEFVAIIENWGMENSDMETILKVKGSLWAVGNIGSMELGAPFLEHSDVVEHIVRIAETSLVMSMRGTAFFVLGLISRSICGQEILAECGWDVSLDEYGDSVGVCLPRDMSRLLEVPPITSPAIAAENDGRDQCSIVEPDSVNKRILSLIADLSNTVLSKNRAAELNVMKARKATAFKSPQVFRKAMEILAQRHVRLQALRFVVELFDKDTIRQVILDDEEPDEGKEGADATLRMFEQSSPVR